MRLDIVTPERQVYSDEIEMLIARAAEGEIGILPNHAPLVTPLKISALQIKTSDKEQWVAIGGGFLDVRPDQITVLAESAEFPEEIDVERAEAAKKRAEERIANKKDHEDDDDLRRAELALERALIRLQVAKSGD